MTVEAEVDLEVEGETEEGSSLEEATGVVAEGGSAGVEVVEEEADLDWELELK